MDDLQTLLALVRRLLAAEDQMTPNLPWHDPRRTELCESLFRIQDWVWDYDAREEVRIGPQRAAPKSMAAINAEVRQVKAREQDGSPDT